MGRPSDKVRPAGITEDRALAIAMAALGGESVVDVLEELDAPPEPEPQDELDELIIELHADGLTDRQMEQHPEVPIGRQAVGKRRERLGLRAHYTAPRKAKRVQRSREEWKRVDASVAEMILDGYSDSETAAALAVSEPFVRESRLRQGLRRNARQAPIQKQYNGAESVEAYDALWRMWKDGKTDEQIAEALGLRTQAVRVRRNKLGLAAHRRPWRPMSAESIKLGEDIARLHATGMTDRQIAEELGLPTKKIADKRWRMHLPVNSAYRHAVL